MFATLTLAAVAVAFSGVAPGAAASEPNATAAGGIFGAYVVDWAHYRSSPYTWSVSDLAPVRARACALPCPALHAISIATTEAVLYDARPVWPRRAAALSPAHDAAPQHRSAVARPPTHACVVKVVLYVSG